MDRADNFQKTLIRKIIITASIIILLTVGVVLFRSYISKSVTHAISVRQELIQKTVALESLAILRSQHKKAGEPYLQVLQNVVPDKDKLINISQEYQRIARGHDLDFGFSFLGETAAQPPELGYVEFRLNLKGDELDQITEFLKSLQNFRFITTVHETNIRRVDQGIEALLGGRVYFR